MKTSPECIKKIIALIKGTGPESSQAVDEPCEKCPLELSSALNQAKKNNIPEDMNEDYLSVEAGQLTFDAEGNDNENSPYFSRKIHWPGTEKSGVTLGRGYDMGSRPKDVVISDLTNAGIDKKRAKRFAEGAGLKGEQARKFVAESAANCGNISLEEQKRLFENTYGRKIETAKNSYNYHAKTFPGKAENWEDLDQSVKDVLVDFVYQGYGSTKQGYHRPMHAGMSNDKPKLIEYIKGNDELKKYDVGRGRVPYLEATRDKGAS